MPLLKKKFYERIKGSLAEDEDWWHLVCDTDAKRLYVEHEWSYLDRRRFRCDGGTVEIGIADFLNDPGLQWEQKQFMELITSLFEAAQPPAARVNAVMETAKRAAIPT